MSACAPPMTAARMSTKTRLLVTKKRRPTAKQIMSAPYHSTPAPKGQGACAFLHQQRGQHQPAGLLPAMFLQREQKTREKSVQPRQAHLQPGGCRRVDKPPQNIFNKHTQPYLAWPCVWRAAFSDASPVVAFCRAPAVALESPGYVRIRMGRVSCGAISSRASSTSSSVTTGLACTCKNSVSSPGCTESTLATGRPLGNSLSGRK